MDASYFRNKSTGSIWFDPGKGEKHFDPWWMLLRCDNAIVDLYAWFLLKRGVQLEKGSRWGAHISVVKGTPCSNWGFCNGRTVEFFYSNVVRSDNGRHAWLDVWCPELHAIRQELELPHKANMSFHLTLGRLS